MAKCIFFDNGWFYEKNITGGNHKLHISPDAIATNIYKQFVSQAQIDYWNTLGRGHPIIDPVAQSIDVVNTNGTVIQSITINYDEWGHATSASVASVNLDSRYDLRYEPLISKSKGYAHWSGVHWSFLDEAYALSAHDHNSIYLSFRTLSKVADSGFTWGTSNVVASLYNDTLQLVAGSNITIETDATNKAIRITSSGGAGDTFKTWHTGADSGYSWGSSDVVASGTDTMDVIPGTNISISTDATNKAIKINVTGITSFPGFGTDHSTAAYGDHTHAGYEPAISKSTGYLTWTGAAWSWKNEAYSPTDHRHDSTYIEIITTPTAGNFPVITAGGELNNSTYSSSSFEAAISKSTGYAKWTGAAWSFVNETYSLSSHNHDSTYLAFKTISAVADSGFTWTSSDVVADLYNDTLKIVAGTNITIDTDAANDAIRISSSITNHWSRVAPTLTTRYVNDRIKVDTDGGYAVWGTNSSNSANTAGIFGDCQDTFPIEARRTAASSNTSAGVLRLRRQCSGGGQVGLGGHIAWALFNANQTDCDDAGKFGAVLTDPTAGAEDAKFEWYLKSAGSSALKMSLDDVGMLTTTRISASAAGTTIIYAENTTSGVAINGVSSSGYGGSFTSSTGTALYAYSGSSTTPAAYILRMTSTTNTPELVLRIQRQSSGTVAEGIGAQLEFSVENNNGGLKAAAKLNGILTTITDTSENGKFTIDLLNAGTSTERLALDYLGNLSVDGTISPGNAYSLPATAGTQGQVLRMKTPVGDNVMEWYTPSASGDTFATWHYAADSGYSWGTSDVVAAGADTMDIVAGTNVTIQTDATAKAIKISASGGTGDTFKTWHTGADSGYSWGSSDIVASGTDTMDVIPGTNITIGTDATAKAIKISVTGITSFPGFGTDHSTAAYGDHTHSNMVTGVTDGLLDLDITTNTLTASAYVAKKGADPSYPYFYLGTDTPTFTTRLNLDGTLWAYAINASITTSAIAITGVSTDGTGVEGRSTSSTGIHAQSNTGIPITTTSYPTALDTSTEMVRFSKQVNGNAAIGVGQFLSFYNPVGTAYQSVEALRMAVVMTDIGLATADAKVEWSVISAGSLGVRMSLSDAGNLVAYGTVKIGNAYSLPATAGTQGQALRMKTPVGDNVMEWFTPSAGGGDTYSDIVSSVVNELVVYSDTSGKHITHNAGTGLVKVTAGVVSTITDNSATWNALVSFPGFGTDHSTAAYGDHTHSYLSNAFSTWHTGADSGYSWGSSDVVASGADTMDIIPGTNITIATDATNKAIRITASHPDISPGTSISSDNSNGTVIQDLTVTIDSDGHVTATSIATIDHDLRYLGFKTIQISADSGFTWGSTSVVADLYNDTLNLVAGTSISIQSDAANDAFKISFSGTIPVKATGAEIDTGTDDAKFATAKAIADSKLSYTDGTETLTNKRINQRESTTTSSATPTPDVSACDIYTVTAQAVDATWGAPTGTPVQGQKLILRMKCDTSSHNIAFNAIYRAVGATLPTTLAASKTQYIGCIYNSTDAKWDVVAVATEA